MSYSGGFLPPSCIEICGGWKPPLRLMKNSTLVISASSLVIFYQFGSPDVIATHRIPCRCRIPKRSALSVFWATVAICHVLQQDVGKARN